MDTTAIRDYDTVIAVYNDFTNAEAAITDLINDGFDRQYLSLIAHDKDDRYSTYIRQLQEENDDPDSEDGAGFGAVVGTLTGLGVALIPGLGGFVVTGLAGAALFAGIGAVTGAGTGGLVAGMVDLGVDEGDAEHYSDVLRNGGAMVVAHVDGTWEDKAESIMHRHNPVEVEEIN